MIKAGLVAINGAVARAASTVRQGDRIDIEQAAPAPPLAIASAAPEVEILFADETIIVVNKPPGLAVHPAPSHKQPTLVDSLLARFPELAAMAALDGVMRPGIVQRLDKDTSGVMVVARTPAARAALARQFKDRTVRKTYVALVRGLVARDDFTITRPLGRHPMDRKRMSVSSRTPRDAISHVTVIARFESTEPPASLVRVRPETGRTHQIRVHLAAAGHPCLGDPVYGGGSVEAGAKLGIHRQALHALRLEINHPVTGARLTLRAPLPRDMTDFLDAHSITSAQVEKSLEDKLGAPREMTGGRES